MNPVQALLANSVAAKAGRGVERLSLPTGLYLIVYLLWDKLETCVSKLDEMLAFLKMHHGG